MVRGGLVVSRTTREIGNRGRAEEPGEAGEAGPDPDDAGPDGGRESRRHVLSRGGRNSEVLCVGRVDAAGWAVTGDGGPSSFRSAAPLPSLSSPAPGRYVIEEIPAGLTHDLRRRVLRGGRVDAEVVFPGDEAARSVHLVARRAPGGPIVGVVSLLDEVETDGPGQGHLRGMAVEEAERGRGVGRLLLEGVIAQADQRGWRWLWANARESALGFYLRAGWSVVGTPFIGAEGLVHHRVRLDRATFGRPASNTRGEEPDRSAGEGEVSV